MWECRGQPHRKMCLSPRIAFCHSNGLIFLGLLQYVWEVDITYKAMVVYASNAGASHPSSCHSERSEESL